MEGQFMKKTSSILVCILILFQVISFDIVRAEQDSSIQEEIIYDIIIDRFNNGDQLNNEQVDIDDPIAYHGGDIIGITKRLPDIEANGFTTIVLSPIWENAEKGYHGYW